VRRVTREAMSVRLALVVFAVMSVSLIGDAGLAAAATPGGVHANPHANPPLGGKRWMLYWFWDGQNQKGPCELLFNKNGTLVGDSDGNCAETAGSWQLSGNTVTFGLKHSCLSEWTATYDTSNKEYDNGTMETNGDSCAANEGTFWLSKAGRIDGITFNGTQAAPSIVITGHKLGTEPTPEAAGCSASGDDFVGGELYLDDVSRSWVAGQPSNCIGLFVSSYTSTGIDYTFGNFYDTSPDNYVLDAGDQLTVAADAGSVLAYVDGFNGGPGNKPSLAEVESPTLT
jgi:hypothetical protein